MAIATHRQGTNWVGLGVVILSLIAGSLHAGAQDSSETNPARTEGYVGLYGLYASPKASNISLGSAEFPNTSLDNGFGGGIKAGLFPKFTRGFLGAELEVFGFGTDVTSPAAVTSGSLRFFNGTLVSINSMVNVVARYPGEYLQPYGGAGAGGSLGLLTSVDFQSQGVQSISDTGATGAFAYQFFGGLRVNVSKRFFVYGEYKYFRSDYKWDAQIISGPNTSVSLDFTTHIFAGGVGIRF